MMKRITTILKRAVYIRGGNIFFTLGIITISLLKFSYFTYATQNYFKNHPTETEAIEFPKASNQFKSTASSLGSVFVTNAGQTDPSVHYYIQGSSYNVYFTPKEAIFVFTKENTGKEAEEIIKPVSLHSSTFNRLGKMNSERVLMLRFLEANADVKLEGHQQEPGIVNYLVGNDIGQWLTEISTFRQVVYNELWPGIDLVFTLAHGQLKYDFIIQPGARLEDVRLSYHGVERISLDETGKLVINIKEGIITDDKPSAYQEIDGRQVGIACSFLLEQRIKDIDNVYGFAVEDRYDSNYPLIIDPTLMFSTILSGSGRDDGVAIAVGSDGSVYVTGKTTSIDLPTTEDVYDRSYNDNTDVFVAKLDPSGITFEYVTYIGGSGEDIAAQSGIAIDDLGNVFVTGHTSSTDFPTTDGAYDTTHNPSAASVHDYFMVQLSPSGDDLSYSTYLGGTGSEFASGYGSIAVDAANDIYVFGLTASSDFPVKGITIDDTYNGGDFDNFVAKFDPEGNGDDDLLYAYYVGGSLADYGGFGTVNDLGEVYLTGHTNSADFPKKDALYGTLNAGGNDAFITIVSSSGAELIYSTYLGGSGGDTGRGIALDSEDNIYVVGYTVSNDFPTFNALESAALGGQDGFISKLNHANFNFLYSSYLGGIGNDNITDIAVDASDNTYVIGKIAANSLIKLNGDGSVLLDVSNQPSGVELQGVASDDDGNAYVVGNNFPDAVIAKLETIMEKVTASVYCPVTPYMDCPLPAEIKIDMRGSSYRLGSFTGILTWDPTLLHYSENSGILSGFLGIVNEVNVGDGILTFNGILPSGADGIVDILTVNFDIVGSVGDMGALSLEFSTMTSALTFEDLMPILTIDNGEFEVVAGLLGDIDCDGSCDSADALIVFTFAEGMPILPAHLERINLGYGNVNSSSETDSDDAFIILEFDLGIPVDPHPVCEAFFPIRD